MGNSLSPFKSIKDLVDFFTFGRTVAIQKYNTKAINAYPFKYIRKPCKVLSKSEGPESDTWYKVYLQMQIIKYLQIYPFINKYSYVSLHLVACC